MTFIATSHRSLDVLLPAGTYRIVDDLQREQVKDRFDDIILYECFANLWAKGNRHALMLGGLGLLPRVLENPDQTDFTGVHDGIAIVPIDILRGTVTADLTDWNSFASPRPIPVSFDYDALTLTITLPSRTMTIRGDASAPHDPRTHYENHRRRLAHCEVALEEAA